MLQMFLLEIAEHCFAWIIVELLQGPSRQTRHGFEERVVWVVQATWQKNVHEILEINGAYDIAPIRENSPHLFVKGKQLSRLQADHWRLSRSTTDDSHLAKCLASVYKTHQTVEPFDWVVGEHNS
jgi:hypothetical protein